MSTASRELRAPAPSLWTVWSRSSLAWVAGLCLPLFALSLHFREPHAPYAPVPDSEQRAFAELDPQVPNPGFPKLDTARVKKLTR